MQKSIKETQEIIAKFADERKWAKTYKVYGIMLNIQNISIFYNCGDIKT